MKTLDEVIAYFDNQTQQRHVYLTEDAEDIYNDALHYLKTYRENQQTYIENSLRAEEARERYLEAVKNCELAENKYRKHYEETSQNLRNTSQITCPKCHSEFVILPEANNALTWDELKQMEGKPVWVEALLYKQWAVIAYIGEEYIRFEGANLYAPECRIYMGEDNGWQAFRKERNER